MLRLVFRMYKPLGESGAEDRAAHALAVLCGLLLSGWTLRIKIDVRGLLE